MSSRMQHLFVVVCFSMLLNQTEIDKAKFSFNVEWPDVEASNIRQFLLFFYKADGTLELYDTKSRRMFLKRTACDTVTLQDLYVGSTVTIFSRQMKIISFADEFTNQHLGVIKQRTFAMIKPEAVIHMGEIFSLIISNGFKISKLKMVTLTKEHAREFYAEHEGKPFFPFLVEYITSGPVIAMELIADNGVKKWRDLLGPTDAEQARKDAPGSVRARFGKDKSFNAAHGSDSAESAQREQYFQIRFIAPGASLRERTFSSASFESSLALAAALGWKHVGSECEIPFMKRSAIMRIIDKASRRVSSGLLGDIIKEIQQNGFKITALQMFYVDHANAEEFYEVYKGVVAEYSDIARKLRPNTLRAKFGKTKLQNALHCTDLPEDGLLEVEYFFKILE
ncbi:Nucleoside diphosphate kinase 7 [Blattella germanica]|nr:Nucleoside diphosphate kinase 7 [Blattella germanica]